MLYALRSEIKLRIYVNSVKTLKTNLKKCKTEVVSSRVLKYIKQVSILKEIYPYNLSSPYHSTADL